MIKPPILAALNKQILGAMGSLTSDVDKDKYSTAMGLLESSKHLMRGSDLATIESTWASAATLRPRSTIDVSGLAPKS